MQNKFKIYLYGLLGNVFDHYELALYGLLAPIFSELFFTSDNQIISYIKGYSFFSLFLFPRLLGAKYFGKLGDKKGISNALSYTLFGMASVAIFIGMLPTAMLAGRAATWLLFIFLMLQNFFASGEKIGGVLYLLENGNSKKRPMISGIYDISSILGYLLATSLVFLLGDNLKTYWRYLYFFSAFGAFLGFLIRKNLISINTDRAYLKEKQSEIVSYDGVFAVIFVTCFSYALYYSVMTLMNSWVPLITTISYKQVLSMNIYLLVLDMLLLLLGGYLSYKYGSEKIMKIAIYLNLILQVPLFYMLKNDSFLVVFIIRAVLVAIAVLFSAPCYHYSYKKTNIKNRFQIIAISNVIGAHLGKACPMISYIIYQKTQLIISPALPILGFGALALYFLKKTSNQTVLDIQPS